VASVDKANIPSPLCAVPTAAHALLGEPATPFRLAPAVLVGNCPGVRLRTLGPTVTGPSGHVVYAGAKAPMFADSPETDFGRPLVR